MKKVYYGGTILTMDHTTDAAVSESDTAVLTEDGVIRAVGSVDEIRQKAGGGAEWLDLRGRTLLPAFIDSHSHLSMLAENLGKADLSEARSFADITECMRRFIAENNIPEGTFVQGYGYDQNMLAEKAHPTREVLDAVSTSHPIYISHVSVHMGVANSIALSLAGIDESCAEPEHLIGRGADGKPNGYVAEQGMTGIWRIIMQLPIDWSKGIREAQQIYLENGILTVQEGAAAPEMFTVLKRLADEGILKLDTNIMLMAGEEAHHILETNVHAVRQYENHVKIAGYKLVLDGSPQGKTAWLTRPYEDGSNGIAWLSDEEVREASELAIRDRMQLLAHCNGDAASEQFLRIYGEAYDASELPEKEKRELRPVMIHCQTVRQDQVARMGRVGMIPSIFVDHVYYWGDVHYENLGEERAGNISPAGWARACGLPYTFHQDTPVIRPNMLRTVQTAVERRTRGGRILGTEHRVSVYEALQAVTSSAAYQYHEEDSKGSITPGKRADFAVLEENPLTVAAERLSEVRVVATIRGDEILYQRT